MFNLARYRRACIAALVIAGLAACSGGAESVLSTAAASHARGTESLVGSARDVTATLIQPLTFSLNGTVATVSLFGTAQCGPGGGSYPNWCPGTNFTGAAWSPSSTSTASVLVTMGSSSLSASCAAPAGAPTPAPGFTPGCYVVALENGYTGPFLIQGPATVSGSTLTFQASSATLSLDGETAYYFFLAYVTAIGPQPTPTPYTPSSPPATSAASASPAPTCASGDDGDSGGHHHHGPAVHKQHHGDDDECESDGD